MTRPSETSGRLVAASLERLVTGRGRQRTAVARRAGLTVADVLALEHLVGTGVLSPSDLAQRLRLSSSGTSAVIGRLAHHGLVRRRADPASRRRALVDPTQDGSAVVAPIGELAREIDALVGALAPGDRAAVERFVGALADLSDRLADRLEAAAEAEAWAASAVRLPVRWG